MPPKGVEDWSMRWLEAQKDLRAYLDEANAGNWPIAAAIAAHVAYCAIMLEQHARAQKNADTTGK